MVKITEDVDMRTFGCFLCTAAVVLSLQDARAGSQLRSACESAEAVVTATVGVPKATRTGVEPTILTMQLDGVIKGDISPTAALAVNWPESWQSVYQGVATYRGLWFLKHNSSGMWEVLPIGSIHAGLAASGLGIRPRSETDGVVAAGASCFQRVWAILQLNVAHIETEPEYFEGVETLFRDTPDRIVDAVPDFDSKIAAYAKSPSASLRALALGSGLLQQKTEYLTQVADQAAELSKTPASPHITNGLMSWTNTEPAALTALRRLAQGRDSIAYRSAALSALMKIHTKDTVPVLVEFLDSTDPQLRDTAIRGLSLFVREVPILTPEQTRAVAYLADRGNPELMDQGIAPYVTITPVPVGEMQRYVTAWKDWWIRMSGKWSSVPQN